MFFKNYLGMIFFSYLDISVIAALSSKCPTKVSITCSPLPYLQVTRSYFSCMFDNIFFLLKTGHFRKSSVASPDTIMDFSGLVWCSMWPLWHLRSSSRGHVHSITTARDYYSFSRALFLSPRSPFSLQLIYLQWYQAQLLACTNCFLIPLLFFHNDAHGHKLLHDLIQLKHTLAGTGCYQFLRLAEILEHIFLVLSLVLSLNLQVVYS